MKKVTRLGFNYDWATQRPLIPAINIAADGAISTGLNGCGCGPPVTGTVEILCRQCFARFVSSLKFKYSFGKFATRLALPRIFVELTGFSELHAWIEFFAHHVHASQQEWRRTLAAWESPKISLSIFGFSISFRLFTELRARMFVDSSGLSMSMRGGFDSRGFTRIRYMQNTKGWSDPSLPKGVDQVKWVKTTFERTKQRVVVPPTFAFNADELMLVTYMRPYVGIRIWEALAVQMHAELSAGSQVVELRRAEPFSQHLASAKHTLGDLYAIPKQLILGKKELRGAFTFGLTISVVDGAEMPYVVDMAQGGKNECRVDNTNLFLFRKRLRHVFSIRKKAYTFKKSCAGGLMKLSQGEQVSSSSLSSLPIEVKLEATPLNPINRKSRTAVYVGREVKKEGACAQATSQAQDVKDEMTCAITVDLCREDEGSDDDADDLQNCLGQIRLRLYWFRDGTDKASMPGLRVLTFIQPEADAATGTVWSLDETYLVEWRLDMSTLSKDPVLTLYAIDNDSGKKVNIDTPLDRRSYDQARHEHIIRDFTGAWYRRFVRVTSQGNVARNITIVAEYTTMSGAKSAKTSWIRLVPPSQALVTLQAPLHGAVGHHMSDLRVSWSSTQPEGRVSGMVYISLASSQRQVEYVPPTGTNYDLHWTDLSWINLAAAASFREVDDDFDVPDGFVAGDFSAPEAACDQAFVFVKFISVAEGRKMAPVTVVRSIKICNAPPPKPAAGEDPGAAARAAPPTDAGRGAAVSGRRLRGPGEGDPQEVQARSAFFEGCEEGKDFASFSGLTFSGGLMCVSKQLRDPDWHSSSIFCPEDGIYAALRNIFDPKTVRCDVGWKSDWCNGKLYTCQGTKPEEQKLIVFKLANKLKHPLVEAKRRFFEKRFASALSFLPEDVQVTDAYTLTQDPPELRFRVVGMVRALSRDYIVHTIATGLLSLSENQELLPASVRQGAEAMHMRPLVDLEESGISDGEEDRQCVMAMAGDSTAQEFCSTRGGPRLNYEQYDEVDDDMLRVVDVQLIDVAENLQMKEELAHSSAVVQQWMHKVESSYQADQARLQELKSGIAATAQMLAHQITKRLDSVDKGVQVNVEALAAQDSKHSALAEENRQLRKQVKELREANAKLSDTDSQLSSSLASLKGQVETGHFPAVAERMRELKEQASRGQEALGQEFDKLASEVGGGALQQLQGDLKAFRHEVLVCDIVVLMIAGALFVFMSWSRLRSWLRRRKKKSKSKKHKSDRRAGGVAEVEMSEFPWHWKGAAESPPSQWSLPGGASVQNAASAESPVSSGSVDGRKKDRTNRLVAALGDPTPSLRGGLGSGVGMGALGLSSGRNSPGAMAHGRGKKHEPNGFV